MNDSDRLKIRDCIKLFGHMETTEAQTFVLLGMKSKDVEEYLKNKPVVLGAYRYLSPPTGGGL